MCVCVWGVYTYISFVVVKLFCLLRLQAQKAKTTSFSWGDFPLMKPDPEKGLSRWSAESSLPLLCPSGHLLVRGHLRTH